jgi:hypothetical protein
MNGTVLRIEPLSLTVPDTPCAILRDCVSP